MAFVVRMGTCARVSDEPSDEAAAAAPCSSDSRAATPRRPKVQFSTMAQDLVPFEDHKPLLLEVCKI